MEHNSTWFLNPRQHQSSVLGALLIYEGGSLKTVSKLTAFSGLSFECQTGISRCLLPVSTWMNSWPFPSLLFPLFPISGSSSFFSLRALFTSKLVCVCGLSLVSFLPNYHVNSVRVETMPVCIVLPKAWHTAHTPELFDLLNENISVSVMYQMMAWIFSELRIFRGR